MPWCGACDRFLSPSTVTTAGTCPRCGHRVDPGRARSPDAAPARRQPGKEPPVGNVTDDADDLAPVPWHLKLLAGAVALYLGYRAFEGVEWVVRHL